MFRVKTHTGDVLDAEFVEFVGGTVDYEYGDDIFAILVSTGEEPQSSSSAPETTT